MIELKNVHKVFQTPGGKVTALSGVSLRVEKGGIFGVIGSSGAGKSTLIRSVNLLEKPDSGSVIVDGKPLLELSDRELARERRNIGMIFQHFNLLSSRTVHENVAFPLELAGVPKPEIDREVVRLLSLVGLIHKQHDYPSSLSGGQKQRVAIARTLANNPTILLCDEATSALDPETTRSILSLLQGLNKQFNLTILLITHEMNVVKAICDKVAVMSEGRIIEQGTIREIFSHPQEALTKEFIASSTHIDIPEEYLERLSQTGESGQGFGSRIEGGQDVTDKNVLVKLEFTGVSSDTKILSDTTRLFEVNNRIVSAQLDYAGGKPFGVMLVEVAGRGNNTEKAIDHYILNNIKTEVLGYV